MNRMSEDKMKSIIDRDLFSAAMSEESLKKTFITVEPFIRKIVKEELAAWQRTNSSETGIKPEKPPCSRLHEKCILTEDGFFTPVRFLHRDQDVICDVGQRNRVE